MYRDSASAPMQYGQQQPRGAGAGPFRMNSHLMPSSGAPAPAGTASYNLQQRQLQQQGHSGQNQPPSNIQMQKLMHELYGNMNAVQRGRFDGMQPIQKQQILLQYQMKRTQFINANLARSRQVQQVKHRIEFLQGQATRSPAEEQELQALVQRYQQAQAQLRAQAPPPQAQPPQAPPPQAQPPQAPPPQAQPPQAQQAQMQQPQEQQAQMQQAHMQQAHQAQMQQLQMQQAQQMQQPQMQQDQQMQQPQMQQDQQMQQAQQAQQAQAYLQHAQMQHAQMQQQHGVYQEQHSQVTPEQEQRATQPQ